MEICQLDLNFGTYFKDSSYGFQDRAYNLEWPQLCSLGERQGNIIEKQGTLEI
jgi:hypothetical protein